MKKIIIIPLLLFCISAFGQFTKPELYTNINTNIRLKTYSPTRMAALLDSLVSSMTIGASMVYPGAGIPLSTGSAWGTSITDNSANWNTAFGWGNHSGLYWPRTGTLSLTGGVTIQGTQTIQFGGFLNELTGFNVDASGGNITFDADDALLTISGTGSTYTPPTNTGGLFYSRDVSGDASFGSRSLVDYGTVSSGFIKTNGASTIGANSTVAVDGFDFQWNIGTTGGGATPGKFNVTSTDFGTGFNNKFEIESETPGVLLRYASISSPSTEFSEFNPTVGWTTRSSATEITTLDALKFERVSSGNTSSFNLAGTTATMIGGGTTVSANSTGLSISTSGKYLTLQDPTASSPSLFFKTGGTVPSTPSTGWVWSNNTNGGMLQHRHAGVTRNFMYGPTTAVNNRVAFFDGTTGGVIKDSGLTLSGTNTGDQTSIVGISGTTAQFNTALSDNDFATLTGSETLQNKILGSGTWWSAAPTITDGLTITFNPSSTQSGFNFGLETADPSVGNHGDAYYNSTSDLLRAYINSSWRTVATLNNTETFTNKTIDPTANTIRYPVRTESASGTYTLVAADENKTIEFSTASPITVTLPNGLSTSFGCTLVNAGGGVITLSATGTLQSTATTIETQYTGAYVQHKGSNVWTAQGALGTPSGGGDFVGPASSVDGEAVVFDGTTGKLGKRPTGSAKFPVLGLSTTTFGANEILYSSGVGNTAASTSSMTWNGTTLNATQFNGVALTTAGVATKYLNETGTYTTPAGGGTIIGSTGATDNRLIRADGTGGSTIQSSDITISDNSDISMGGTTAGSSRAIVAQGSATDVGLTIDSKGNGQLALNSSGGSTLVAGVAAIIRPTSSETEIQYESGATSTVLNVAKIVASSSGTGVAGFGAGLTFRSETAAANAEDGVVIQSVLTDATPTSEDFDVLLKTMAAGATATEKLRVKSTGQLQLSSYTSDTSFTGTPVGYLQFDASGNIITATVGGGSGLTYAQVKAMKFK